MSNAAKPCPCVFCEDRRRANLGAFVPLEKFVENDVRVRPTQFESKASAYRAGTYSAFAASGTAGGGGTVAKAVEPKPESFILAGLRQQRITQRVAYKNASDRIGRLRKELTEAVEQRHAASVKITELTRAIDKLS